MLFSSRALSKDYLKQFAFSCQCNLRGVSTLQPCHNLVHRDLDGLSLPKDTMLVCYIDDITLNESGKEEVPTTLDICILVRFLRVQWCGTC